MKYVWIIMLAIVFLIGWIYTIYDIIITFKEFRKREAILNLEDFSYGWVIANLIVIFIISIVCFIIY